MVVKVKKPLAEEYQKLHAGQILYTYLHLAADDKRSRCWMSEPTDY